MTYIQTRCNWCGVGIVQSPSPGRPRKYCRRSHRQRAYEARRYAQIRKLDPDEVILSRESWETLRRALGNLQEVTVQLVQTLASDSSNRAYATAVGGLNAAVAELQVAIEVRAAW